MEDGLLEVFKVRGLVGQLFEVSLLTAGLEDLMVGTELFVLEGALVDHGLRYVFGVGVVFSGKVFQDDVSGIVFKVFFAEVGLVEGPSLYVGLLSLLEVTFPDMLCDWGLFLCLSSNSCFRFLSFSACLRFLSSSLCLCSL